MEVRVRWNARVVHVKLSCVIQVFAEDFNTESAEPPIKVFPLNKIQQKVKITIKAWSVIYANDIYSDMDNINGMRISYLWMSFSTAKILFYWTFKTKDHPINIKVISNTSMNAFFLLPCLLFKRTDFRLECFRPSREVVKNVNLKSMQQL